MIDLRVKELPHTLECDGRHYEIETDFRKWIEFDRSFQEEGILLLTIFKGEIPASLNWFGSAMEFLENRNSTPNYPESMSDEKAFDFVEDGAYIVAGFMQCYGIDLTTVDYMHWHVFKALFDGLSEDTKMARIINYRTWTKDNSNIDDFYQKQKRAWRLVSKEEQERMADARRIAEVMYEREVKQWQMEQ